MTLTLRWKNGTAPMRKLVKALSETIEGEVALIANQNGLMMNVIDPSHVSLIHFEASPSTFDTWGVQSDTEAGLTIGFPPNWILGKLKDIDGDLYLFSDGKVLDLGIYNIKEKGRVDDRMALYHYQIMEEGLTPEATYPKPNLRATATMVTKGLLRIFKEANTISDNITLTCNTEGLSFTTQSEEGKYETFLKGGHTYLLERISLDPPATQSYTMEYMTKFLNAIGPDTVKLDWDSKIPIRLDVSNGLVPELPGCIKLYFWLAPRVD